MLRLQVFLTQEHLAISMEFAQGGDLFAYTLGHRPHGRLAETQSRWIFQQLIIGLDYCHRKVSLTLTGISAKVQPSSPCISSLACRREQPCISSLASSIVGLHYGHCKVNLKWQPCPRLSGQA